VPILFPVLNAPAESDQQPSPHVHTLSHIGYEAGRKEGGPKDYPRLTEPDQGGNLAGEKRGDSSLGSVRYNTNDYQGKEGCRRGGEGRGQHIRCTLNSVDLDLGSRGCDSAHCLRVMHSCKEL